jgi:hypothetical protein
MIMFKKMLAMFAIVAAVLFGTTVPAQAAYSDCAAWANTVCFHQYTDYTGQVWRQTPAQIGDCKNMGTFNDKASTAFNTTTHYMVIVYQLTDCGGNYFIVGSGMSYAFTGGSANAWWDNRISSVQVIAL